MDIDTLRPGVDFVKVINESVGSCEVLIAVIGKQWLTSTDEKGLRRLDDPDDFIRLEISAALDRDVRVIPALVGGAAMPKTDLPAPLENLVRRQAIEISDGRFHQDVDRLIDAVEEVVGDKEKPLPFRISNFTKRRASILGLALALLVVAFVAYLNLLPPTTVVQPKATIPALDAEKPPSPTVEISASPSQVEVGNASVLHWTVTNATVVTLEPGIGKVPPKGSLRVFLANPTTYTITAKGDGGEASDSTRVRVAQPAPAKKPAIPTVVISAAPAQIKKGESSVLKWIASDATDVTIDQGIGTVGSSGSQRVHPESSITYTVAARGEGGTGKGSARIEVTEPPPLPQKKKEPISVEGDVQASKLIKRVEPNYPDLARQVRVEGTVILEVTIGEVGNVADVKVIRGHPLLNDAALVAVRQWIYSPTLLAGEPVSVIATVSVHFRLL